MVVRCVLVLHKHTNIQCWALGNRSHAATWIRFYRRNASLAHALLRRHCVSSAYSWAASEAQVSSRPASCKPLQRSRPPTVCPLQGDQASLGKK